MSLCTTTHYHTTFQTQVQLEVHIKSVSQVSFKQYFLPLVLAPSFKTLLTELDFIGLKLVPQNKDRENNV